MGEDSAWQNLGRGFFVLRIMKYSHSTNMIYCIDTICGGLFYKKSLLKKEIVTCVKYETPWIVHYCFICGPPY